MQKYLHYLFLSVSNEYVIIANLWVIFFGV